MCLVKGLFSHKCDHKCLEKSPAATHSTTQSISQREELPLHLMVPVWLFPVEVTLDGTVVPPENPQKKRCQRRRKSVRWLSKATYLAFFHLKRIFLNKLQTSPSNLPIAIVYLFCIYSVFIVALEIKAPQFSINQRPCRETRAIR